MGILSENLEPNFGKLSKYFTYIRGTLSNLGKQRSDALAERYSLPIHKYMRQDMVKRCAGTISEVFELMTAEDILPDRIIDRLREYGIICDAVVMTINRKIGADEGRVQSVEFGMYTKKSKRERYSIMGHITLVLIRDSNDAFWDLIEKQWARHEPTRLTAIFRAKKRFNMKSTIQGFGLKETNHVTTR